MKPPFIWFDKMNDLAARLQGITSFVLFPASCLTAGKAYSLQTARYSHGKIKLAEAISSISDPFIISVLAIILILVRSNIDLKQGIFWFVLTLTISILPTVLYIMRGLKIGEIHDWFITNREERYKVLLVSLISLVLLNVILELFGAPSLLLNFARASVLLELILLIITFFWKISIHTATFSFFATMVVILYGQNFAWIYLLLLLIGWSRNRLKKHTWQQLFLGAIIPVIVAHLVFKW